MTAPLPTLPARLGFRPRGVGQAQQLLRRCPDRPVSAIGRECGFPSDTQFHRVFRELTGMTPVGYRDAPAAARSA